jgi:hypothetical protein
MEDIVTKDDVLKFMETNNTCDGYPILFTTRWIAHRFNITKYRARKLIKMIEAEGHIKYGKLHLPCDKDYESGDCYCENHLPIWGYDYIGLEGENK